MGVESPVPAPSASCGLRARGIVGWAFGWGPRRGAPSLLIDGGRPGEGATPGPGGGRRPPTLRREGGPLLDLTARSLDLFEKFVARVTSASGIPVMYRRTGTLDVAMDEETMGRFRAASGALAARGVAAELLDARAARTEEPHLNGDVLGAAADSQHMGSSPPRI